MKITNVQSGQKVEPKPKAVSVGAVSQIGNAYIYTRQPPGLFKSNGFKAPMGPSSSHKSGSQGKH